MHAEARELAARGGVEHMTHLLDGGGSEAIVQFLVDHRIELLVIGLHRGAQFTK
jgi:hypothetical protein